MDKCLRSLLISLAGAESEVNSGSLSELARVFLASDSFQSLNWYAESRLVGPLESHGDPGGFL